MLAKASPAGRGFSGKIDYLFEGKLAERDATKKQAQIICHSDNIRVPNGSDDLKTRALLKADFIEQAKKHQKGGKSKHGEYVGEHILSFTNEDRKQLNTEKLREIIEEFIKLAGLDKTQYLAVTHHDTANLHVHILFNRAMNDGKKYAAWKEQNKTIERGIALALEHGFALVKNQKEIANGKEVIQLRSQMQDIKDLRNSNELLSKARNLLHLEKLCEAKKIPFSNNELLKTVTIDSKTYQEANLKAVFLLNRNENNPKIESPKVKDKFDYSPKKAIQTQEKTAENDEDIKLKKQEKSHEQDESKKLNRKKRPKGYQIKIEKIKQKKELKKGRGI